MTLSPYPIAIQMERVRRRVVVRGLVQGVGFRPFVYRSATKLKLVGWVANTTQGVMVEAEGGAAEIEAFLTAIRQDSPTSASIVSIESQAIALRADAAFVIRESMATEPCTAEVSPDLATCAHCLEELFEPSDRRFRYPFITCAQCGPRYSIIESLPYDRARTSIRRFAMCPTCRAEYNDPNDRRFHAETISCSDCGPRLVLSGTSGDVIARDHDAMAGGVAAVRKGLILAVKGIGGFHLLADARDDVVIQRLRQRKRRVVKPFAVMFASLCDIEANCRVSRTEAALLNSPARPIVLLRRRGDRIAKSVAPGGPWLGALLPYAPVHHLLMRELGFPVMATSGNISDEPIVTDEGEAMKRLAQIADVFLTHDRPIIRPIDDSVARVTKDRELIIRCGRGYAPVRIAAPDASAGVLGVGGHLKSTIAVTRAGGALLSQHLGDLKSIDARESHSRAVADMLKLYGDEPRRVACDLHPDYASSAVADVLGKPVTLVQHHLAHVVSCLAENGASPPALGVAWDGAGLGPDGVLWGGEFLVVRDTNWRRIGHLRPFRLPGGEAAVREPRRAALGLLFEAFGVDAFAFGDLPPVAAFRQDERDLMKAMLAGGVNAPWTTSIGRLFDAFAALTGLCQLSSYEGQAAIEFEGAAQDLEAGRRYEFPLQQANDKTLMLDWRPALEDAILDMRAGVASGAVSAAFHDGLAQAIVAVASRIGETMVALSGGCFQNARLTEATVDALTTKGFKPIWHRRVPPNDGGVALGQAIWAAWTGRFGES